MQPLQNQAWTSRHLVSKLPYIQIQLSVDIDGLWRLTPCCSSHLEAVRKVLLPIDSRLHPILRIQKALPCSDFLTSILQARLNAADYTEQDSTRFGSAHCRKRPSFSSRLGTHGSTTRSGLEATCQHMASTFLLPCVGMSACGLTSQKATCAYQVWL